MPLVDAMQAIDECHTSTTARVPCISPVMLTSRSLRVVMHGALHLVILCVFTVFFALSPPSTIVSAHPPMPLSLELTHEPLRVV